MGYIARGRTSDLQIKTEMERKANATRDAAKKAELEKKLKDLEVQKIAAKEADEKKKAASATKVEKSADAKTDEKSSFKDTLQKDFADVKQKAKKDKEDGAAAQTEVDSISDEAVTSALAEI